MWIIGLGSLLGVIVFAVMFIVSIVRGASLKKPSIGMAVCFVLFLVAASSTSSDEEDKTAETEKPNRPAQSTAANESEPQPSTELSILDEGLDTSGYMKFDSEVLFEYGNYFGGEKVVTVITAYQPSTDVKAQTENNDSFFHSLLFKFENEDIPGQIEEGDVLTIAGTIKEKPEIVDLLEFLDTPTVTIENCSIIGHGEIAEELKAGVEQQRALGAQKKAEVEAQIAAAKKAERDNYVAECTTVNYNDVARNPDNYDGTRIKISGKVVQVSEGLFDSVTMRIDCGGNMWYVTYSREEGESRILEGDQITGYGECRGVTSYTTVLGSQVTIPSMRMEYYN